MIAFMLSGFLVLTIKVLLFLLVSVAGLALLRRVPQSRLRRRASTGLWILLGGTALHWPLNSPLEYFIAYHYPSLGINVLYQVARQVARIGATLLQVYAIWILIRVVVQALRKLPVAVAKEQEHNV